MAQVRVQSLIARLIHVTGDDAQVGVRNNLKTPATIHKIFYISTADGSTVEGTVENPGIVRPGEEKRLTVSVPETLDPSGLTIKLSIYAETLGVHFTEDIKLTSALTLRARLIHVTGDDAQVGVKNNLKTPATINKIFYISTADGSTVEGTLENPGVVRPGEERKLTVSVPETLNPSALTIKLTIYAETHGVHFTEDITLSG